MKPKPKMKGIEEYIEPILEEMIDLKHSLCKLSSIIDWEKMEEKFSLFYSPDMGRPGKSVRLMVGLHYLKYTYNVSDENVVQCWLENPYWQYFTGERVFQTELPINPTTMTKWRNRVKSKNLFNMLEETIRAGFQTKYLRISTINQVNADTTVQEKNITFPTDVKLYYKMIEYLNKLAKTDGIKVKQSYLFKGKKLLRGHGGYIHAKQFRRAKKASDKLRVCMGRLSRDIGRKASKSLVNSQEYLELTAKFDKLFAQKRKSKNKLYSIHAPEVECISKGKSHRRYEFGNKVGVVCTSKKGFILSSIAYHGNPYDGHTLQENLSQANQMVEAFGKIGQCFVDLGYRKLGL